MPRRTNVFQQVVRIIHEHLATDAATVVESDELIDRITGTKREVDVTLTSDVGGQQIIISIEATAQSRRASVTWVDGMLAKHSTLPTNKLVLVSQAGFSKPAQERAAAHGAVTLQPQDLAGEDASERVISRLGTIKARATLFKTLASSVSIKQPDGKVTDLKPLPANTALFADDGTFISSLGNDFVERFAKDAKMLAAVILPQLPPTFYAEFEAVCGSRRVEIKQKDGSVRTTGTYLLLADKSTLRAKDTGLRPIESIHHRNRIDVESFEVSLTQLKLGDPVIGHYGTIEGELIGSEALVVVTERDGDLRASLRYPDGTTKEIPIEDADSRRRVLEEAVAYVNESNDQSRGAEERR
jgi:hypothetical protein